ncbi:MAG: trehalose-phosphatase [Anaeromyxobacter sp.]|nr:trehalose-phosphatase [Anaeromyxobacter sp.]MBL0277286.1 trehalose-phosphatase [Anaeromyxobacter sp.]
MQDLLLPRHRATLRRFAGVAGQAPVLLAFDYDGVLAPLVKRPGGARMRRRTRALLVRLARLYPVAVVSGRAWKDTRRMSEGVVPHVVGNHGFELLRPLPVPAQVLAAVRGWRRQLEAELSGVPGLHFEDKRSTLAIHYGLSRAWRGSEAAVYAAANRLSGTRLVPGKKVLNVLPHDFPNKGDALRSLLARLGLAAALYLGDDVTDEDAFKLGPPLLMGVHVGPGPSLAPWRLAGQAQVDELLEVLVALRQPAGRAAPPRRPRARAGERR